MTTFPHSLQNEIDYINRILTGNPYAFNSCWLAVIRKRVNSLQSKIDNLRNFANKKDGRVKDWMIEQLDYIQSQLDSIVWAIE